MPDCDTTEDRLPVSYLYDGKPTRLLVEGELIVLELIGLLVDDGIEFTEFAVGNRSLTKATIEQLEALPRETALGWLKTLLAA